MSMIDSPPPVIEEPVIEEPSTPVDTSNTTANPKRVKTRAGVRPFKKLTIPELKDRLKTRGFENGLSGKRKSDLVLLLQKTRIK